MKPFVCKSRVQPVWLALDIHGWTEHATWTDAFAHAFSAATVSEATA